MVELCALKLKGKNYIEKNIKNSLILQIIQMEYIFGGRQFCSDN